MKRPITARDKCDCARRELALRKNVYPKRIAEHKMTSKSAEWEIGVMSSIVDDYCRLADFDAREERLL